MRSSVRYPTKRSRNRAFFEAWEREKRAEERERCYSRRERKAIEETGGETCRDVKRSGAPAIAPTQDRKPKDIPASEKPSPVQGALFAGSTDEPSRTRCAPVRSISRKDRQGPMRLRELEQAERQYLIFNGWHSTKVRGREVWSKPPVHSNYGQETALSIQKAEDRAGRQ
jgi:hypothetical protein